MLNYDILYFMVTKFKPGDAAAIAAVIILSAVLVFLFGVRSDEGELAVIGYDGGSMTVSLENNKKGTVDSHGYTLEYEISDGNISVTSCNCPDRICVNTGPVSKPGESIICMPAHIVITVSGGDSDVGPDIVAG